MKILLTGSEGFVGSYVYDRLKTDGHTVIGLDMLEPRVHGTDYVPIRTQIISTVGQTPYTALRDVDVLIHLAAQVSVADSMSDPFRYLNRNTVETYELLATLRHAQENGFGPNKVVVASSSSVYGNVFLPFSEHWEVRPTNVYGLTKFDQEQAVLLWCDMLKIDAVALRFFNIYGPGQAMRNKMTGVMANFARELLAGRPPQLTEDGLQLRDFIHVEDVADAVVLAATKITKEPIYNICTGTPTTLIDATTLLADALGVAIDPVITGRIRAGDQRDVIGSNHLFCREFPHWKPRTYAQGIKEFADAIRG